MTSKIGEIVWFGWWNHDAYLKQSCTWFYGDFDDAFGVELERSEDVRILGSFHRLGDRRRLHDRLVHSLDQDPIPHRNAVQLHLRSIILRIQSFKEPGFDSGRVTRKLIARRALLVVPCIAR